MSNFAMGTILGKGFACSSTSAEGTSAMNCMHECLSKTLFQNYCPHGKIPLSNSTCIYNAIMLFSVLLCKAKKKDKKIVKLHAILWGNDILWFPSPIVD